MKKKILAVALAAGFALPAFAEEAAGPHTFTANVGVVSDYIFRGISQSQHLPALQGGVDYAHSSGLYAGVWGSTIKWVKAGGYKDDSNFETDIYGGFKNTVGDFGYDVGLIRYYYPGDINSGMPTPDTTEAYLAGSWKFLTLKYSQTLSDYMVGWTARDGGKAKGSYYWDLSAAYDLGEGWGVNGHVGYQSIKDNSPASYNDWKLGVTKDVGFGVVGLSVTGTNAEGSTVGKAYNWDGKNVAKTQAVLSFLKTF